MEWDEVVLKNKATEKRINSSIRTAVKRYKLSKEDAAPRCNGEMDYEPEFKIVYASHGVISYELTTYTYFKGGAHGGRLFENLNFNTATGKQISFRELIDSNSIAAVDSLII